MATLMVQWVWLVKAGRWIAGSRVVQAVVAVGTFIAWLKWQMVSAKREGRSEERERIEEATHRETKRMEERANEVHEDATRRTDDELAERLRDQSRRHGRR